MTKTANVIIKLNMTKDHDRLSSLFLTKTIRKFGFSEILIGMVYKLLANKWYSVLINGQVQGIFKSTRGVKQGEPYHQPFLLLLLRPFKHP